MQRFKNYSIITLTIAILVCSSTTLTQTQEPPATSRPEQQQDPSKPADKYVKRDKPIPRRYIVVLKDDVVSDKEPVEVRRERVAAIANSHAQTYGGKVDYIYETALKGYAIELPDEAAAIAISKLPQVKWVEQDAALSPLSGAVTQKTPEAVCRGKSVPVSLLERPFGLKLSGPRTSYLKGGMSQRGRLVIRDRAEFNELWNQITSMTSNKPPLPEVDFSREMLLVAAMGQHLSSVYDIVIDGACEVGDQLEVFVRITKFPPCGVSVGVFPEPLDIVRLPKTDRAVVFRETEVTVDCQRSLRPGG